MSTHFKPTPTLTTESFFNLSPLEILVSRNVDVSISDTSAVNVIVGCWLFACSMNSAISFLFIAELRRPEGPPSGAPYSYGTEKETHQ